MVKNNEFSKRPGVIPDPPPSAKDINWDWQSVYDDHWAAEADAAREMLWGDNLEEE